MAHCPGSGQICNHMCIIEIEDQQLPLNATFPSFELVLLARGAAGPRNYQ